LFADRDKLYERLDEHEQRLVVDIARDLLDKYDGEVSSYEREVIRNVAIDVVKRWRYNEHAVEADLMEDMSERAQVAYNRLAKRTTRELEQLGLLEDGPAMTQAENTGNWMEALDDASSDD
jgi:hypothetical protein